VYDDFLKQVDCYQNIYTLRKISIGKIGPYVWIVVYTERKDVIRIISARKANRREGRRYHECIERAKIEED